MFLRNQKTKPRPGGSRKAENPSFFRFFSVLLFLLSFQAGGCAIVPALAPDPKEKTRTYDSFVAVLANEGDTFSSLAAEYLGDPAWGGFLAEFNESPSPKPGQALVIPLKPERRGGLTLRGYQTVPVLSYHNFSSAETNKLTVSAEMFARQMKFLKENGYQVIPMDHFFDFLEFKRSIPPKSVVLTIDDGWLSGYEIAFPILKEYGYPATFFIYTDIIGRSSRALSWELLREMSAAGMDIQCHTVSHRNLTVRGGKESFRDYFDSLEKEMAGCRDIIQNRLKAEVKYLAYPYGLANSLVAEMARKNGYRGALTIHRGGNPFFIHNFRVNRAEIHGDFTMSQFENNLSVFREQSLK